MTTSAALLEFVNGPLHPRQHIRAFVSVGNEGILAGLATLKGSGLLSTRELAEQDRLVKRIPNDSSGILQATSFSGLNFDVWGNFPDAVIPLEPRGETTIAIALVREGHFPSISSNQTIVRKPYLLTLSMEQYPEVPSWAMIHIKAPSLPTQEKEYMRQFVLRIDDYGRIFSLFVNVTVQAEKVMS